MQHLGAAEFLCAHAGPGGDPGHYRVSDVARVDWLRDNPGIADQRGQAAGCAQRAVQERVKLGGPQHRPRRAAVTDDLLCGQLAPEIPPGHAIDADNRDEQQMPHAGLAGRSQQPARPVDIDPDRIAAPVRKRTPGARPPRSQKRPR